MDFCTERTPWRRRKSIEDGEKRTSRGTRTRRQGECGGRPGSIDAAPTPRLEALNSERAHLWPGRLVEGKEVAARPTQFRDRRPSKSKKKWKTGIM